MKKRFVSVVLALLLAVGLFPAVDAHANVSVLAGNYVFDLAPEGLDALVFVTADTAGNVYAEVDIFGDGYYVRGIVVEANGLFTVSIPDFGLSVRFYIVDGEFVVYASDFDYVADVVWEWLVHEFGF